MLRGSVEPNYATIVNILPICASLDKSVGYCIGRETHCYVLRRAELISNVSVCNALLSFYLRVGQMEEAELLFRRMKSRDLVSWNAIIAGYASNGYVNCGSYDEAYMIFKRMSAMDITTWNLMIRAYADSNCPDQALSLFLQLQVQGLKPDAMTIMSLLPVCSQMASVHLLRQCHGYVIRACFNDVCLEGSLVDLYAKCGSIGSAYKIFQSSIQKDLVMFTAMVGGYAMHGMGEEALKSHWPCR